MKNQQKILCVYIPNCMWQIELLLNPKLFNTDVIVSAHNYEVKKQKFVSIKNYIISSSPNINIDVGTPLEDVIHTYENAHIIHRNITTYNQIFIGFIEHLTSIVPNVEISDIGTIYMDINNLNNIYENEYDIVKTIRLRCASLIIKIGLGDTKWAAYIASITAKKDFGYINKITGSVSKTISSLPIEILPLPINLLKQLKFFNFNKIKDISETPIGSLQSQFGSYGKLAWDLSNGIDKDTVKPHKSNAVVSKSLDFSHPITDLQILLSGVSNLLSRAYLDPIMKCKYIRKINIHAEIYGNLKWDQNITFKDSESNQSHALMAIKNRINLSKIPGPIENLTLSILGTPNEFGKQISMISKTKQKIDLDESIANLQASTGKKLPLYRIGGIQPSSRIPERRYALIQLNP
ncbi:hypothetical protein M1N55_06390 [Dehalococcoidia bacterium]|nr:hypothetical protein [Dehalococcoidia bacterium]